MQKLKCRTAYNARDEHFPGIVFVSDSLTQQHFKDECDVNKIVDRYVKTGILEHQSVIEPHYGDVSDLPTDLMAAYDAVGRAEAAFADLPSDVRKALDNDPARLQEWLVNPENRADAEKYGLIMSKSQTFDQEKSEPEKVSEPAKE